VEKAVTPNLRRLTFHDWLWLALLVLFVANLVVGAVIIVLESEFRAFILAVGAFSLAYALHLFSISATLCGVQIREVKQSTFDEVRKVEHRIVTYGMLVMIGGSVIVLSASLSAFKLSSAICIYGTGAVLQLCGMLPYVLCERRWADDVRTIVNGKNNGTESSPIQTPGTPSGGTGDEPRRTNG
jgi:hypothetical protein